MTRSFLGRYRSLSVARVLLVAMVAALGVNVGGTLSPATASVGSSNWTSYMNGNNSGFNSSVGFSSSRATITPANASMLEKVWTATSGGPVFAQPIVADGTVYWGSFDGYERATSTSGKLAWKTFLGTTTPPAGTCIPPSAGVASTATYQTDVPIGASRAVLFVGGGDASLYALDAHSGAVLWRRTLGTSPTNMIWDSPAYYKGSLYVGLSSYGICPFTQGKAFRIDARTGKILNTLNLMPRTNGCAGDGIWGSPAIDASHNAVYFVTGNAGKGCPKAAALSESIIEASLGDLHIVDHWAIPAAERVYDSDFGSTPNLFTATIKGKTRALVGVVNKNGIYYAFDRTAIGAGPVWSVRVAAGGPTPEAGEGTIAPDAWDGQNRTLYTGGDAVTIGKQACAGSISAVDPNTGRFQWRDCLTDGYVIGAVSGAPGFVVVGEGTHLLVVRTSDGHILYNTTGNAAFMGPATISNGVIYATDVAGDLTAFATPP
jgi:outer membrane protein assembly factor BamB